ncbi:hypothetical protein AZA_68237 [Nitrospirillum viridazoti Y2]|nr:hypothetical protein AZA_68237 [Nitrospirillum amazonense Y2]
MPAGPPPADEMMLAHEIAAGNPPGGNTPSRQPDFKKFRSFRLFASSPCPFRY